MTDYEKIYADSIVSEYTPKNTSKATALKKLDRKAKLPAQIFTYTFGVIAALMLGVGMCLTMNIIGGSDLTFAVGIIVGILGITMASVNYFLYKRILDSGRRKYGEDILKLAKEIQES